MSERHEMSERWENRANALQATIDQLVDLGQEVMYGLTARDVDVTKLADSVQRFRELINSIKAAQAAESEAG